MARNALVAVQGHDHALLRRGVVTAIEPHWIAGAAPALPARLASRTRYRMAAASCAIETAAGERLAVHFDAPQWAPTPGQYLVVYDGDVCLGGAVIE